MKSELEPLVSKVSISRRLKSAPAVIVGDVSASMRVMMKMMDQTQFDELSKNQTIEINPNHSLITKLNDLRKSDQKLAAILVRALVDNIFLSTGLPIDTHKSCDWNYKILDEFMEAKLTAKKGKQEVIVEDMP